MLVELVAQAVDASYTCFCGELKKRDLIRDDFDSDASQFFHLLAIFFYSNF